MKQQKTLFEYFKDKEVKRRYSRKTHGGTSTKGRRKLERPLTTKRCIHLVLKSDKAHGRYSFLRADNKIFIERLIYKKAKRFGIKIGEYANVGNHLHLKIKVNSRALFQAFLRSISGRIARHVTGAKRGNKFGRFWQGLAFTRVLTSAAEELDLGGYIKANVIEARHGKAGREYFLKIFNSWIYREKAKLSNLEICSTA